MDHRYGRHGPRAWLRWRQRRYGRPSKLPVPVEPQPTVVCVFVPTKAERIIFIIMEPSDIQRTTESPQIDVNTEHLPTPHVPSLPQNVGETPEVLPDDTALLEEAKWQVFRDKREIKNIIQSKGFVLINRSKIGERIENLVDDYLDKSRSNGSSPPSSAEYQRLVRICNNAYWKYFQELMAGDLEERIDYLDSPEEVHLRAIAIQDKKETLPESDYSLQGQAVIRVLQELQLLPSDIKDRLPEIYRRAGKYEKYYSSSGEEVIWPSQEPFQ
jgi:hypothetical protein